VIPLGGLHHLHRVESIATQQQQIGDLQRQVSDQQQQGVALQTQLSAQQKVAAQQSAQIAGLQEQMQTLLLQRGEAGPA
jgi:hypothetical protein